VIYLLVAVLVLAAAAAYLVRRKRGQRSLEEVAARKELTEARAELKTVTKNRDEQLKPARMAVKRLTKDREKAIAAVNQEIAALRDPKGRRLGRFHGVTLYERWIDTPHGGGPVDGCQASVDSQLSSRFTATRLLAFGVFALAIKKKTGNLYLSIDGPTVASVVECTKNEAVASRQFAVKILNAGKQAGALTAALPGRIENAQARLNSAVQDTRAIDAAKVNLTTLEQEPNLTRALKGAQARAAEAERRLQGTRAITAGPAVN
jgi:hypothetical protein